MELKRYNVYIGDYTEQRYEVVKLSDIKEFFGIGDCGKCILFEDTYNYCRLFACHCNNVAGRIDDCIKTFGE